MEILSIKERCRILVERLVFLSTDSELEEPQFHVSFLHFILDFLIDIFCCE